MKKILLGIVAALALSSFVAPAFAEDAPAGDKGAEKPAKKGKKGKKADKAEGGEKGAEGAK
jgi:hypothetical protein